MAQTSDDNLRIAKGVFTLPPEEIPMEEWFAPSVTLHYPGSSAIPWSGHYTGLEAVQAFLGDFYERVETAEMSAHSFDAVGDKVFIRGHTLGKVRATQKAYRSDWCLVWTFKDKKCISMHEYQDTEALATAVTR